MRVLLVNPTIADKPEHLHLGLATIGTYVQRHGGHVVRILDFVSSRRTWRRRLQEALGELRPDLVGLYISSPYFPAACQVAREIKRLAPATTVLAGGHHPTLSPGEVMEEPAFDLLIVGEGEKPVLQLLDALAAGRPLAEVPGLWWREDGAVRRTPMAPLLDAGDIPPPDWSLHDEETLRAAFYLWGILPVMASRGCPASCSFCAITNVQRLYEGEQFLRFRDPIEVVDEIEANYARYRHLGLRIVFFYDLNFLLRPRWLEAFTAEYRRRGLHHTLKWSAYTRADHVSRAALAALEDSGCVNLRIGIEAASPYMRNEVYHKELSQEELTTALRELKRLGISLTGYFMAGGPGERPEYLLESLELAKREGIEYPVFFLYQPLAGTDILARTEELGATVLPAGDRASDFLHGVNLRHRHVRAWQLEAFLLLTHGVFGAPLVLDQLRREGWRYVPRMARYLARAVRLGFPAYLALTYFVFYGYDHLAAPWRLPRVERPGAGWRALMGLTRLWLRSPRGVV